MVEHILPANLIHNARLLQSLPHIGINAREDDGLVLLESRVDEDLEVVDARSVDEVNPTHTDNTDGFAHPIALQLLEPIGHAKEEGTLNLIDLGICGNHEFLIALTVVVERHLLLHNRDVHALHNSFEEENNGQDEAHLDSDSQVEDDRQEQGEEEDSDIATRLAAHRTDGPPATHIIRHNNQHTSQAGHRNEAHKAAQEEQNQEQNEGVNDTCNGSAAAIIDVGHRAGNSTRRGDTAKEGNYHIGNTVGDKLRVGVVPVANHTVGHHCRQEALNGTQHSDSEGCGQNGLNGREEGLALGQSRQAELGQTVGQLIEVADGLNGLNASNIGIFLEQPAHKCHNHNGQQRAGNLLGELGGQSNNHNAHQAHAQRPEVHLVDILEVAGPLIDEVGGHIRDTHTEQVVHLGREDGDGDTAREAHDDGIGHKLDDRSEFEDTHQNHHQACQDGGNGKARKTKLLDDAIDDDNEGTRGATNLHLRTAQSRDQETGQDGGHKTLGGAYARSDTKGDRQRNSHDTDDDTGHQVFGKFLFVVALECREQTGLEVDIKTSLGLFFISHSHKLKV